MCTTFFTSHKYRLHFYFSWCNVFCPHKIPTCITVVQYHATIHGIVVIVSYFHVINIFVPVKLYTFYPYALDNIWQGNICLC